MSEFSAGSCFGPCLFFTAIGPAAFLGMKEGLMQKEEESHSLLIRASSSLLNIPVATIGAIALSIINVLSLIPFVLLTDIQGEKPKKLKEIIQINNKGILVGFTLAIASIINLFTLTFARGMINQKIQNHLPNISSRLEKAGILSREFLPAVQKSLPSNP